jgi:hypothetical protein
MEAIVLVTILDPVVARDLAPNEHFGRRCLVCMDRMVSTGLGRPCAIQDEEYVHSISLDPNFH